jgi:hypothetical protein
MKGVPGSVQPLEQMPLKTAQDVNLTAEEKRQAAAELWAKDVPDHQFSVATSAIEDRYSYSCHLVDPCKFPWSKSVRIVALVMCFVDRLR